MMEKDGEQACKFIKDSTLMTDALAEASENMADDYAVKLCCSSLLVEVYIVEPDLIASDKKGGLGKMTLKDSILMIV